MARRRAKAGQPIQLSARDHNDTLDLLDQPKIVKTIRHPLPKLVVIPPEGVESGTVAFLVVRKIYGTPVVGSKFFEGDFGYSDGDEANPDKIVCINCGSDIAGPALASVTLHDGGYWTITSVFC